VALLVVKPWFNLASLWHGQSQCTVRFSWKKAGLDELLADTGRIQRAREEAAQRHSELYRPVPRREAPKGPGEGMSGRTACASMCTPKDTSRTDRCRSKCACRRLEYIWMITYGSMRHPSACALRSTGWSVSADLRCMLRSQGSAQALS
jgi:hypothetical protein